jgi:GDP-L-fucose synthase
MVGSAVIRLLSKTKKYKVVEKSHQELDLTDFKKVEYFFQHNTIDIVINCAARVGGIQANIEKPAEFLYENLLIQNNLLHCSYLYKAEKYVFLGSSCIYPKECIQPIKEDYLLTGKLEPTNEGYALAKIAGVKMCEYYHNQYGFESICLLPCNLYGTNDSFDPKYSHVLSALVKKFSDAVNMSEQNVTLWGTGIAYREFMHVDDMAEAILFFMENYFSSTIINIGWGKDISIEDLAILIARNTGFKGNILWDDTKPNGMLRKCLDVSKMNSMNFRPKITLEDGIKDMIEIYKKIIV